MSNTSKQHDAALTGTVWERRLPTSRDRSSLLTREEIAAAAFAVAENENLGAVSVKRVAGRLGIPGLRLDNYLADRGELLDLMVDVALGEVLVDASRDALDWRVQLWHIARDVRSVVQHRPWLAALLGVRATTGPNGLLFTERALRAVNGLALDVNGAAQVVQSVLTFVCGSVRQDAVGGAPSGRTSPDAVVQYLASNVSADEFPLLSQLFAQQQAPNADDLFDAGLTYLLAGISTDVASPVAAQLA